jgi:hypothetical protein
MGKMSIGICVPHDWLVEEYDRIVYERLVNRFDLSNVKIGTPDSFKGIEVQIMIVSAFRNSAKFGLGYY